MALIDRIKDLAIRIGQEIKLVRTEVGTKVSSTGNISNSVLKTNGVGTVIFDTTPVAPLAPSDGDSYVMKDGVWIKLVNTTTLDWTTGIINKPTEFNPTAHDHDDRYYTETELDAFLLGKSDTAHLHDDRYYTETELDGFLGNKEDSFSKNTGFNKDFGILAGTVSEGNHNHNDVYFTKTEINTLLSNVGNSGHDHNDIYYTKVQVDTLLQSNLGGTHTHDDRYFTEAEVTALLSNKSNTNHNHDDRYYTEAEIDTMLAATTSSAHTHDDRYYTETELDNFLDNKADLIHAHDDRYFTEAEVTSKLDLLRAELEGQILSSSAFTPPEGIPVILQGGRSFGKYLNGDTLPGNTSLLQLVREAVSEYVAAQFIQPVATLVGTPVPTIAREVGETLSFTVVTNYVQNDAGIVSSYIIRKGGVEVVNSLTDNDFAETNLILTTAGVEYTSTVNFEAGTGTKPNSLGVEEPNNIGAGSTNTNTLTYKGYMPIFYGSTASVYTTGAEIRNNLTKILNEDLTEFTLNTGNTHLNYQFWVPTGTTVVSVVDIDALSADITASYLPTAVSTTDAGGNTITGTLYTTSGNVPYSTNHRHKVTISNS